jgi:oligopeptide transport system substrate-binding protein
MSKTLLTAVLALLLACSCGESDRTPVPGVSKIYRHAMDGAATSLDPAHTSTLYANFLIVNLYDTLYRYKYLARPYTLEPNLASALPEISDDGLELTIRLKPGVKFIDDPAFANGLGREVTAHDFVYSIQRHFDPKTRARGAWLWQDRIEGLDEWKDQGSDYQQTIAGLKAIDNHTLRIRLRQPYPQFTHTLAQGYAAIVAPEAVAHYGPELASHPVGSGPFMLTDKNRSRAVLARNPDFRREPFSLEQEGYDAVDQERLGLETLEGRIPPFADQIEVEFIPEDEARWNVFQAGAVDFFRVPVTRFDTLLQSRDPLLLKPEFAERYHHHASIEPGFVHTDFNMGDPRIGHHPDPRQNDRNRALRCAIVKAFDWDARNRVIYYGIGRVFPGIIPPIAPEFDATANLEYVTRDVDAARALLAQAGWNEDNLPVLEYGFSASVDDRQMFEQFRSFMADIGYPTERIRPVPFASFGDFARAFSERELMMITHSWTMDYPDAQNTVQLFFSPNASPGSNISNFEDPGYDRLYRAAVTLEASPERTRLFRQMNQMIIDECASISGISRTQLFLWNRTTTLLPDESFVGGYAFRFADPTPEPRTTP